MLSNIPHPHPLLGHHKGQSSIFCLALPRLPSLHLGSLSREVSAALPKSTMAWSPEGWVDVLELLLERQAGEPQKPTCNWEHAHW